MRRRPRRQVLARGPLWLTYRHGAVVIRRGYRWYPASWQQAVVRRLAAAATRLAEHLAVAPVRERRIGEAAVAVQPFLSDAIPLRLLSAGELAEPRRAAGICAFWQSVRRCWQATGRLPDVGGRVYVPWELYQPLKTANVLVQPDGQCWLVDVAASSIFHSARWPTGRLHAWLLLRALDRAARRLGAAARRVA